MIRKVTYKNCRKKEKITVLKIIQNYMYFIEYIKKNKQYALSYIVI